MLRIVVRVSQRKHCGLQNITFKFLQENVVFAFDFPILIEELSLYCGSLTNRLRLAEHSFVSSSNTSFAKASTEGPLILRVIQVRSLCSCAALLSIVSWLCPYSQLDTC